MVLIISPWNFPVSLITRPLVGAIAAGNCVVIKPSEVSENVAGVLAPLLTRYMDQKTIRVVQGAVAESTALLKERFDKICYTGNGTVAKVYVFPHMPERAASHSSKGDACCRRTFDSCTARTRWKVPLYH